MNHLYYGDNLQWISTRHGKFPKLQIFTIEELFAGNKPKLPWIDPATFKKAARESSGVQDELDI